TVSGRALTGDAETPSCPCLSEDTYNILLLHGQLSTSNTLSDAVIGGADDSIPLAAFMNRNVDYLALGHIHSFRHGKIDRRGTWCYPGCPEGRGFDECGDKGFVVLNLDGNVCRGAEFVPFAKRRLQRVAVDVSGLPQGTHALEAAVEKETEGISETDFIRVVLTGEDDAESIRDTAYLQKRLSERYYYAEVTDERRMRMDPAQYRYDISLRGEFVRRVMASDLSEEDKSAVLRRGLAALKGE
ncbi:MAG: exonuclease SbcCD subunit D, partial [Eubacteriales bacterium]